MKPYGCNNSERRATYVVPVRNPLLHKVSPLNVSSPTVVQTIADTSTIRCQYRKDTPDDPRCEGCRK